MSAHPDDALPGAVFSPKENESTHHDGIVTGTVTSKPAPEFEYAPSSHEEAKSPTAQPADIHGGHSTATPAVVARMDSPPLPAVRTQQQFARREGSSISSFEEKPPTIDLSWGGIHYTVPTDNGPKVLLKNVTGTAKAGRLLVIMGPSGAGKSTLLNALCGRLHLDSETKLDGVVCLNDVIFSDAMRPVLSFVAQDDIIMPKETPYDALNFALAMKQSSDEPAEAKEQRVMTMLEKLRLMDAKDTIMGIPGVLKGVSGGEKKRTNIGVELITNPPIMMLDEPTSGLDSVSALRIGELMRSLAHDEGRTVLCTLHTPSSELFQVFDDLLLMARGSVVYHGPLHGAKTHFASVGHPVPARENPSEFYMRLLQSPPEVLDALVEAWAKVAARAQVEKSNVSVMPPPAELHDTNEMLTALIAQRKRSKWQTQLKFLCGRSWRNTMRDRMLNGGRFVQALFFGILFGLMFINLGTSDAAVQDRQGCLYLLLTQCVFMSMLPALLSFPSERPIFIRDASDNLYSPSLYYLSKVIVEFPVHIAVPTVMIIIVYFMADLVRTGQQFFIFWLLAILAGYCGQAMGMMLSAIFSKLQIVIALGPLLIMPIMLVGGLMANTDRLEPGWVWLMYISYIRYGFKGVVLNEFQHINKLDGPRYKTGQDVIAEMGFTKRSDRWQVDAAVIFALMVFMRLMGALALEIHGRGQRSQLPYVANWRAKKQQTR